MKRVFTTGTFDILHYGHINLLKQAKSCGDYLIVGLNVNPENKIPYYTYDTRKYMLESIKYVDEVVPIYNQEDKFNILNNVDLFVIGNDYVGYHDMDKIKEYCEVKYIDRTPNISTSIIKSKSNIKNEYNTIVIDVDETICYVQNRDFENAIPNKPMIDKINYFYDSGKTIILYTARGQKSCSTISEMQLKYGDITKKWLENNGVKYHKLVFGKPNADYYVDDKAMSIKEFLSL